MGSNQSKMDALNSQMNTLVESQAQEIKELHEQLKTMAECSDAGMLINVDGDCIHNLKEEISKLKERQMIMGAVADEHINDMNGIHKEYGDMVRKLKEEVKNSDSELVVLEHYRKTMDSFDEIFTGTKLCATRVPELEGWSPFSEGTATIDVIVPYLKARLKEIVELKRDKFDYNIFLEEKTNMAVMLSELHSENAKLKKDYDKNWAAMECLSFMDYKYEDGEWKPYED
jgi:DNA repair exonuclease SbcCD ATPase subunit